MIKGNKSQVVYQPHLTTDKTIFIALYFSNPSQSMANLPFHNYIGPGNPLNNGPPVDLDDEIALLHDHRYANAKSEQDIHKADNEAIGDFLSNVHNPHSAIGALGLGAKRVAEFVAGKVIYPNMKRAKVEPIEAPPIADSTKTGTGESLPQAGGSVAGGTGSSIGSDNVISDNPTGDFSCTFTNSFQVYTGAFQFKLNGPTVKPDVHGISSKTNNYLSTPLSVIDPNDVLYYMSQVEFYQLTKGNTRPYIWATHAEFDITPLGYRLPFATNEAASGYANSQTLVQIATSVGLERHFGVFINGYNNSDADPTTTESYNDSWSPDNMIWGQGSTNLGAVIGIPRHHNRYATIYFEPKSNMSEPGSTAFHPRLVQYMDISNVNDVKGGPVIKYKYDFKCAPIAMPDRLNIYADTNNIRNFGMHRGPQPTTGYGQLIEYQQNEVLTNNYVNLIDWTNTNLPLEKSPYMSTFISQDMSVKSPPLIYFGCLPIQSNAPLSTKATFSPGVVVWKITARLHVRGSYKNTANGIPSPMALDPIINYKLLNYLEYNHRLFYAGERIIRKSDRAPTSMDIDENDDVKRNKNIVRKLFK